MDDFPMIFLFQTAISHSMIMQNHYIYIYIYIYIYPNIGIPSPSNTPSCGAHWRDPVIAKPRFLAGFFILRGRECNMFAAPQARHQGRHRQSEGRLAGDHLVGSQGAVAVTKSRILISWPTKVRSFLWLWVLKNMLIPDARLLPNSGSIFWYNTLM